jgi:hypothetical protein
VAQQLLLDELKKGPVSWNEWRRAHPSVHIDLAGAYLAESNLRGYNLRRANLAGCVLVGADLTRADLRDTNLSDSDVGFAEFEGARLAGAHFDGAEGVSRKVLKASLPRSEFVGKRRLLAIAATVASIVAIVYWQELLGLASTSQQSTRSLESSTEGYDRYERLTREIRKVAFPTWKIEAIEITDDTVALRVDRNQITDDTYLLTLAAACGASMEVPEVPLREIHVLNREGNSGWIYDNPAHCGVLLSAPIATLKLSAAANSRPFISDRY